MLTFDMTRRNHSFDEWLDQLRRYKAEHGDTRVPKSVPGLGTWVRNQRQAYQRGRLPAERQHLLDELGFEWNPALGRIREPRAWRENMAMLREYQAKHGHTHVPYSVSRLGSWVSQLRISRQRGLLTEDQIAELDELGFDWLWSRKKQRTRASLGYRDIIDGSLLLAGHHLTDEEYRRQRELARARLARKVGSR